MTKWWKDNRIHKIWDCKIKEKWYYEFFSGFHENEVQKAQKKALASSVNLILDAELTYIHSSNWCKR